MKRRSSHSQSILLSWREAAQQGMMPWSPALSERSNPASVLEESLQNGYFLGQDMFPPLPTGSTELSS